jgi:hypothetical protein
VRARQEVAFHRQVRAQALPVGSAQLLRRTPGAVALAAMQGGDDPGRVARLGPGGRGFGAQDRANRIEAFQGGLRCVLGRASWVCASRVARPRPLCGHFVQSTKSSAEGFPWPLNARAVLCSAGCLINGSSGRSLPRSKWATEQGRWSWPLQADKSWAKLRDDSRTNQSLKLTGRARKSSRGTLFRQARPAAELCRQAS